MTSPNLGREWRTQNCTAECRDSHTFLEGCTFYKPNTLYAEFDDVKETRNSPVSMGWKGVIATWCVVIGLATFLVMAIFHIEMPWVPLAIGGVAYFLLATAEAIQRHRSG